MRGGGGMGAYIPGFDHDVFVSYAHVDNLTLPQGSEQPGWVHTLVDNLKVLLAQKLGRQGLVRIWVDRRLTGCEPFTPDIEHAVKNAATILIVLSEGYVASEWCQKENTLFRLANEKRDTHGRIFLVRKTDVPRNDLPERFRDLLGYRFFEKERDDAPARTLGWPVFDPTDSLYFRRIDDLSRELTQQLKRMHDTKAVEEAPTPPPEEAPEPREISPPKVETPPTVFLAEVTADLREDRDNISRDLEQAGIRVLPKQYYDRATDAFREAMTRDLSSSDLFVQLLGRYISIRTENLPTGYEGLQLELAKAARIPILRWHRSELDIASAEDPDLIHREPVMVMGIEDFKREIKNGLRSVAAKRDRPNPDSETFSETFVLLSAKSCDLPFADIIAEQLESNDIGYEIIDESVSLPDLANEENYNALAVVYGNCEPDWAQQQVRLCRQVMLRKKNNMPVCAIISGSTDAKPPLRIKPPRFMLIDGLQRPEFQTFLDKLRVQGT
jgi:hypothetical protein